MIISAKLFIIFYLVFCLLPNWFLFVCKRPPKSFIIEYILSYSLLVIFLTLFKVNISGDFISVDFSWVGEGISFGLDSSLKNMFLNAALCVPLGVILPFLNQRPFEAFCFGALLGAGIEFLQAALPFARVVDLFDILFCALFTWLFSLVEIANLHLNFNLAVF